MGLPKYLSETVFAGSRSYLIEVKEYSKGGKYMIITRSELDEAEQSPVIIFEHQMHEFLEIIERATDAACNKVPAINRTTGRRAKKASANPPEFCNSGKRWTKANDELLIQQFQNGATMEALTKVFQRREKSIEVRLYKLGLLPSGD